jgi:hypothetical protein
MILGCVQPSYLAWIPLFQRMQMSDVFVYLDDVEYSKNSYHNRNRIKTPNGPLTLTVPVNYRSHSMALISDIPIAGNQNWADKHLKSIRMHYAKAPFFREVFAMVEEVLSDRWAALGPLNIAMIEQFRIYLGLDVPCHASSALCVEGQGNEKLVNLCETLGARHFVVKPNTEDYHPRAFFLKHDIQFALFSPETLVYDQMFGEFVPNLSILDYAMHVGPGRF